MNNLEQKILKKVEEKIIKHKNEILLLKFLSFFLITIPILLIISVIMLIICNFEHISTIAIGILIIFTIIFFVFIFVENKLRIIFENIIDDEIKKSDLTISWIQENEVCYSEDTDCAREYFGEILNNTKILNEDIYDVEILEHYHSTYKNQNYNIYVLEINTELYILYAFNLNKTEYIIPTNIENRFNMNNYCVINNKNEDGMVYILNSETQNKLLPYLHLKSSNNKDIKVYINKKIHFNESLSGFGAEFINLNE